MTNIPPADLTAFYPMPWGPAIDLRHHSFFQDPYPYYSWLRDNDPVHQDRNGNIVVTRYNEVRSLLKSGCLDEDYYVKVFTGHIASLKSKGHDINPLAETMSKILFFMDGEEHADLRRTVASAWKKINFQNPLRETEAYTEGLLQRLDKIDSFDVVHDFAARLPAALTCKILELPIEAADLLLEKTSSFPGMWNLLATPKQVVEINKQMAELIDFFIPVVEERRINPGDDLISHLLSEANQAEIEVNRQGVISSCIMFAMAGIHTFAPVLSNSILAIIRDRSMMEAIFGNDNLPASAAEEFLRYDTSVQLLGRRVRYQITVGNTVIKPGQGIYLCIGSANRDQRAFPNPDHIDLTRKPNAHLSFGHGSHSCMGAAITRMLMPIALAKIPLILRDRKLSEEVSYQHAIGFRIPRAIVLCKCD